MATTVAMSRRQTRRALDRTRPEIQALRALAVMGVVVYHLWPTRLPGGFVGVDVFFVLSGFLITDHLLREHEREGRISLGRFWARRARRLLPASLLVLVVVAAGVWFWVPDTRWAQFGGEIIASSLYVENWALAAQSVDYMALANVKSPVQHFWSLGVEEQFYLLWPLVVVVTYVAARRIGRRALPAVAIALVAVTAASFLYSVVLTAQTPTVAYFSTFTRAWEFGAGALLAVAVRFGFRQLPAGVDAVASWVGVLVIAVTMFIYDAETPFPSYTAALPVAATVLVIAGGTSHARWSPARLFGARPVQFIGDVSYGTYLWHWPLIVLAPFALGSPNGILVSLAIIAASLLLGWASKRWVEDPVRTRSFLARARTRWTLIFTAAAMAATVAVAVPLATYTIAPPPAQAAGDQATCYGAAALSDATCEPAESIPLTASLSSFSLDLPPADILSCELPTTADDFRRCEFGEASAQGPHVALLGDSHATRWVEALAEVAAASDGRLSTFLVSGCASATDQLTGSAWGFEPVYAEQCRSTSQRMIEAIAADPSIDTVVMTDRTRLYVTDDAAFHPLTAEMVARTIEQFQASGKRVIVLEDPPEMNAVPPQGGGSAPDCLMNAASPEACSLPRTEAEFADPMRAGAELRGAESASLDDLFCDAQRCMAQIGGLVVYSDDNHLTRSYALSLVDELAARLSLG
jgi:peptidoglycan/LPS O-acetylase OafA/YrhL